MKLRKLLFLMLCFAMSFTCVYAETADQQAATTAAPAVPDPVWNLQVLSDFDLTETDVFSFTLQGPDGAATTYDVDASACLYGPKGFTLPAGNYTVTDIVYRGTNAEIKNSGYGINKAFALPAGGTATSYLYIGKTQILMQDQSQILMRQGENIVESISDQAPAATTQQATESSTAQEQTSQEQTSLEEKAEPGSENAESTEEIVKEDPDKEDVVEVVKDQKEEEKNTNSLSFFNPYKLGLIFLVGLIGVVGIFIWNKKNG